jgi:hypothetical protein
MGKVGSGSINRALHSKGIHTLHAHWMTGDFPEAEFPTTKPKIVKSIRNDTIAPLKVIVPIREPMARNLSAFAYNLIKYGATGRQETVEELYGLFLDKYNIHYPDLWFESELLANFDLDPYSFEFDHRKGYKIYKAGRHEVLIIRLEDAERVLAKAVRKFLKVRGVEMIHHNNFEQKKYIGHKYKELKTMKYPGEFVNRNYGLRYAQHFYTEAERQLFKDSWMQ